MDVNPKILIVEADLDVSDMVSAYFRVQGYEVLAANSGEEGLRTCQNADPNLVVLDVRLPDINGYEVARRLRTERRTQDIPIIFLTEKSNHGDRLQELEISADDYITKPFDIQELRLRVRNALRRSNQGTLTNPVSGLPDGALVDEKLKEILQSGKWSILLVSLFHLENFRDAYGFVASDDVLRAVSIMIRDVIQEQRGPGVFVGHLTVTDFIAVVPSNELASLKKRIGSRLEQSLDYFYPIKDRDELASRSDRLVIKTTELASISGQYENIGSLKKELLDLKH